MNTDKAKQLADTAIEQLMQLRLKEGYVIEKQLYDVQMTLYKLLDQLQPSEPSEKIQVTQGSPIDGGQNLVMSASNPPDRYPMCKDQPAQIDCRLTSCIYHSNGSCTNVSPAITLNPSGKFICWTNGMEASEPSTEISEPSPEISDLPGVDSSQVKQSNPQMVKETLFGNPSPSITPGMTVCNYCNGKGKIYHFEFGQYVKCGVCKGEPIRKEEIKPGMTVWAKVDNGIFKIGDELKVFAIMNRMNGITVECFDQKRRGLGGVFLFTPSELSTTPI